MADADYAGINYKSICCEQIPDLFLDKVVAKKYFSKFGKINRFILRPKRLSCTVEYETEEEAARALEQGGNYNGIEFIMKYAERDIGHVQNTEEWVDADVQAELEAMGGRAQAGFGSPSNKKLPSALSKVNNWPKSTQKAMEKETASTVHATPKIDVAVRSEIEALLRQPAMTSEEKYRVLDARDKLIRLLSIRQTDIAKAQSRRGTCPDMCPEKERLMRDFQRQVAVFEMNKSSLIGSISHRRAIKEYSRSSADQEVPLLHELRPENVLKMTMLWLMHNIMDILDGPTQVSVADWFHFLWDRTRSIRKDITQQELCSLDAVELVEQCARFHIHCGARLVAEDPSVFDKKINAENLTKCLQTLKYLYHDLRLKNVRCPREAEFRGYIVLLNLGNSNFLWEVKQLPEHIQQSTEIKRAMKFYNVLQNNNFVRFFDMIREKETSYLCACILLNYFTKLRFRAMEAIIKSHNWRKDSVFLPLEYLTRILGFEDENAAVHFFGYHGLECSEQRGVMLDKITHASDYSMDRAIKLVESKRLVSVGECIYGRPLDSCEIFEKHQPHNSFDENGILKTEAWTADDQLRGEAALAKLKEKKAKLEQILKQSENQTIPQSVKSDSNIFKIPQVSSQFSPKQQEPQQQKLSSTPATAGFSLFNQAFGAATNNSLKTDTPSHPGSVGSNFFSNTSPSTGGLTSNLFGNIAKTASSTLPAPNISNNAFQPLANNNQIFSTSGSIFGSLQTNVNQALEEERKRQRAEKEAEEMELQKRKEEQRRKLEIEQEEARKQKEAEEEQKKREMESARAAAAAVLRQRLEDLQCRAISESESLICTTVEDEIAKIAQSELSLHQSVVMNAVRLTEEILAELIHQQITTIANIEYNKICHDRMLLQRYFTIWIKATRKKIEQRRLLDSTPTWVSAETHEQIVEKLQHPSALLNLEMIKRYRRGEPSNINKLLWDDDADLRWRQSIDICDMIAKHMAENYPIQRIRQRMYFKMLFTLPAENEELYGLESLFSKWLQLVLRFPTNRNEDSPAFINTLQQNIALCVRKVSGTLSKNEIGEPTKNAECDNVDGIVFFMSVANLAQTRKRLHHLIQSSRNFKKLPFTFVVYGGNEYEEEELVEALDIMHLVEHKKIYSFRFFNCRGQNADHKFKLLLEHALNFIISTSIKLNLEITDWQVQSTQSWLETCLGEEMWRCWNISQLQNVAFAKVCSIFTHVVGLYNEAIERLKKIIAKDLQNAPEFPNELLQYVPTKSIETPLGNPKGLPHFPKDWKLPQRQQFFLKLFDCITLPNIENAPPENLNDLKLWLLNYAGECIPEDDEKATTMAYYAIKSLIDQLTKDDLQMLEIPQRMCLINYLPIVKVFAFGLINEKLQKAFASKLLPTEVIYNRKDLDSYLEQPWWLNYHAIEAVTVDFDNSNVQDEKNSSNEDFDLADIEAAIEKAEQVSNRFEKVKYEEKENIDESHEIFHKLNQTVCEMETVQNAALGILQDAQPVCLKRSRKSNDQHERTPKLKRSSQGEPTEADDIISKALAIIDRVNALRDVEFQLDYTASKLEF